jgi:hypothetical protein
MANQFEIGAEFNKHFTNFVSPLSKTKEDFYRYINNIFKDLKRKNKIRPTAFFLRPYRFKKVSNSMYMTKKVFLTGYFRKIKIFAEFI